MKMAITGKIGSGKSFVAKEIAAKAGVPYVSVDAIVAESFKEPQFKELAYSVVGERDKAKISDKVFANPALLESWVNASAAYFSQKISAVLAQYESLVMEYPLLLESGDTSKFDYVVYVDAPKELRMQRAAARDSASLAKIRSVDSQQASDEVKRLFADYVVQNAQEGVSPPQIQLLASLFSYPALSRSSRIFEQYAQPHRAWHNLCHLSHSWNALVQAAPSILQEGENYRILLEANQFHDIVYDTRRGDNEIESIRQYKQQCESSEYKHTMTVAQLILSTVTHQVPSSWEQDVRRRHLNQLFLDSDLAIFAEAYELVDFYDEAIRQEYSHVPDMQFYQARLEILRKFNARQIFLSEEFSTKENIAHENLERLIHKNFSKLTCEMQ